MNIPQKIINNLQALNPAIRGQVYCALISYMNEGSLPDFEMTREADQAWQQTKAEIDPILRRRERDRIRRQRKKQLALSAPQPRQSDDAEVAQLALPTLSRQQRRALERRQRKESARSHRGGASPHDPNYLAGRILRV